MPQDKAKTLSVCASWKKTARPLYFCVMAVTQKDNSSWHPGVAGMLFNRPRILFRKKPEKEGGNFSFLSK
ncbi:MAG TPA: hypothetical protein DCW46_06830 [Desulfotomaculum sp.]|nr:hypothetical protein [Desulfotomaculum sp.]